MNTYCFKIEFLDWEGYVEEVEHIDVEASSREEADDLLCDHIEEYYPEFDEGYEETLIDVH
jgi:hypothetical protein